MSHESLEHAASPPARRRARRWPFLAVASLMAVASSWAVSNGTGSGQAGAADGNPTLDLRVLVVSTGPREADAGAELMARTMDQTGTPYDILDSSSTELTAAGLRTAEGHGRYNGIVLTQADLYTPSGSGFTAEEWAALHAYEREFAVREAVVSGFPTFSPALGLDYGMGVVGAADTSTGRWVAPAGTGRLFSYVNAANTLDIPEYSVWGTPRADATAPRVTPLLVDDADASHVFVSQLDYADGRQVLLSTVGNAWYRLHSNVIAYQFLDWATKGLFIGARQVSLSTHTDDMFLADDLWDPAANVTDPNQQYRLSAADLDNVVARQQAFRSAHPLAAGWKVQFPYNGSGASTTAPANPRVTKAVADDATLNKAQAGRNYGRATTLALSRSSSTESRAVLRAADVAPPSGTVTKVFLNLRVTSNSAALPVQVCAVSESWVEGAGNGGVLDVSGTTWNNRSGMSVLGSRWKTAGGTYAADHCVSATLPATGAASVDITPIWQAWNSKAIANNGLLVRATANGTATLASAEAGAASRPSIAIDSVGAPDALTARAVQLKDQFGWINHTYNALQMDRLCPDPDEPQPAECPRTDYQTAYDDIAQNRVVWTDLALPGYQEGLAYLLSDSHAGLHDRMGTEEDASDDVPFPQGANPNFLQAAQDLGVRYIASDSSRPNQDKEQRVPGFNLILLPRYPTNVYVNATTPEQNVDEYNWIYHDRYVAQGQDPCTIPAAICTTKTYDQLLAWEADTTVGHMLSGRAWPHYFHQSNLRDYGGGRTLQLDWMDAVMTRYEQLFTLPVLTPTAPELGPAAEDRIVAAESHVRGSVDLVTGVVTLQADGTAHPMVTGLASGPDYGGQSVGKVTVGATPTTFTAEDQVRSILAPPPAAPAPDLVEAAPTIAPTEATPPSGLEETLLSEPVELSVEQPPEAG